MTNDFQSFFQKTARLEENIYSGCHLQIQFRYSADTAGIPSSSHKTQLLRNFSTLLTTAILGNSM